jgi:hypothetical protein
VVFRCSALLAHARPPVGKNSLAIFLKTLRIAPILIGNIPKTVRS